MRASMDSRLEKPTAYYALLAAAPEQSLEHTNHVKFLLSLRFHRFGSAYQVTLLESALGKGVALGIPISHGQWQWESMSLLPGN